MKKRFNTFTLGMLATSMMLFLTVCDAKNIGAGNEKATSAKATTAKPIQSEWYVRLIAEIPSENMKDKGNVLGQLQDSINGYDSHDLFEMPPFGNTYLTIVFPHPEWEDRAGDYTSDYHSLDKNINDEWIFQVKTSAVDSNVTLRWEGLYVLTTVEDGTKEQQLVKDALLEQMWVEDTITGQKLPVIENGELQNYTFNMDGQNIREFRWGIGKYKEIKPVKITGPKETKILEKHMDAIDLVPGKPKK